MEQISEFFLGLFSTHLWPPRWQCGIWSEFQGWLYICSDVAIWGAYFAIPLLLVNIISKKKLPFVPIFWLFGGFILFCGFTHLIDAIVFYYPIYRFAALMRFCTAIISWVTVFAIYKVLPRVFSFKTPEELQEEIESRKKTEAEMALQNVELERTNMELDRFVYTASHDLRAPLTSVSAALNFVIENNKDENLTEIFSLMEDNLKNLDGVIYNMNGFCGNKNQIVLKEISLPETLYQKAKHSIPIGNKTKDVLCLFEDEINEEIFVDTERLVQIIRILLDNAITYCDTNKAQRWVKTTFKKQHSAICIEVEDNGIGIDDENKEKIFQIFFRANNASTGSGLGLYLLKEIVTGIEGEVTFNSVVNQGTKFKVIIPL